MAQIPVTLIKLKANQQRLRTWSVAGTTSVLPTLGHCFELVGVALEGPGLRFVNTSPVVAIERPNSSTWKIYTTSGSIYLVMIRSTAAAADLAFREETMAISNMANTPV